MSELFSPITLRGLTLENRVVVSPMCQYSSDDGLMHDWHLMHLGQFAMGAAALVFTECTHVSDIGRISPKCAGLWNDDQEREMKRVIDFCHQYGTAKMAIQLGHAGRKASTQPPALGAKPIPADQGGWETIGPSPIGYDPSWPVPREMTRDDMDIVVEQFVDATKRADRLGFALVELHIGHGYLLNQFFSPLANQRSDEYGGTLENRMRFPLEVFKAVREALSDDKPLGVRVSASDWVEGGTTVEDTIELAKALEALDCDFIDITSAGVDSRQRITVGKGYQVGFAAALKKAVSMPVMAVGMIIEPEQAEAIIADGEADFVMLARGMMYDPRWAWHAAMKLGAHVTYPDVYARSEPKKWPEAFGLTREPRVTGDQRS